MNTVDVALLWITVALYFSFFWLPIVFAAYAVGRRQFNLRVLLVFMCAEAIAIYLAIDFKGDIFG